MIWFILLLFVIIACLPDLHYKIEEAKKKEQQCLDAKRYQTLYKSWRI